MRKKTPSITYNAILRTGKLLVGLMRLSPAPLPETGKDPSRCESRRPVPLINTAVKILEGALYQRILPAVETQLGKRQHAYRRGRGTEAVLAGIMDFARRPRKQREICVHDIFRRSGRLWPSSGPPADDCDGRVWESPIHTARSTELA